MFCANPSLSRSLALRATYTVQRSQRPIPTLGQQLRFASAARGRPPRSTTNLALAAAGARSSPAAHEPEPLAGGHESDAVQPPRMFAMRSSHRAMIEHFAAVSADASDVPTAQEAIVAATEQCEVNCVAGQPPGEPLHVQVAAARREAHAVICVTGVVDVKRVCRRVCFFSLLAEACMDDGDHEAEAAAADGSGTRDLPLGSGAILQPGVGSTAGAPRREGAARVTATVCVDFVCPAAAEGAAEGASGQNSIAEAETLVLAWKRGVKRGDRIQLWGVPGRSLTGSAVLFCWRLVIIGTSYDKVEL